MYPNFELEREELVCEPEAAYRLNRELSLAWDIVEQTGANLFLTGRAGTGKTTFLRKLRELSKKRMVVLAPTGVAAISAQGTTLHSFFQLPFSIYLPGKGFVSGDKRYLNFSKQKKRLIASLSLLVIDEISMVRPDILDAVDMILRRLRNSTRPFGGLQLLLIGDLRQLPPVVKESEWTHLADTYATPYFFESKALRRAGFHTVELSTIYRQNDREFIAMLNDVRDGKAGPEVLARLNSRHIPGFNPPDREGYIRLTTHNRIANDINESRLRALPTREYSYRAEVKGDFPEQAFPTDGIIRLKVGAQVMFIKNDVGVDRRFYNGLIATVTSLSDDSIIVAPVDGGPEIRVERMEWENTRYVVDEATKQITQEAVGWFNQYPLRLAWAITIHKSQGLTFDRAIIDASLSFAPGQTYVALSRCRSLEGMVLGTPLPAHAIIVDKGVNDFIDNCKEATPDETTLQNLKTDYEYQLLRELFDFSSIKTAFADFSRFANEYLVPLHPELYAKFEEVKNRIGNELAGIGQKFTAGVSPQVLCAPDGSLEKRDLLARIAKGCDYFCGHLDDVNRFLTGLPRDIDNRAYAEQLNGTFTALMFLISLKGRILQLISSHGFSAGEYLRAKGEASLEIEEGKAPKAAVPRRARQAKETAKPKEPAKPKEKKPKKPKKPKGYSTFETLKLIKEGKSIEEVAAERRLKPVTVTNHISELIDHGLIKIEALVPGDDISLFGAVVGENPDADYATTREILNTKRGTPISDNFFSLLWRRRPGKPS